MAKIKRLESYCVSCDSTTYHSILFNKTVGEPNPDYHFEVRNKMIECDGCGNVSFRVEEHDFESPTGDDDGESFGYEIKVLLYPQVLKQKSTLFDTYSLPSPIKKIYLESIEALKVKLPLLTAIGFRGVVEAICNDKGIIGDDLEKMIKKLTEKRFITINEENRLHAVRFLGNDSIHDLKAPDLKQLYTVLGIIDHLLNNLYILDEETERNLQTVITEFQDFHILLILALQKFNKGDDFPLTRYMATHIRRCKGNLEEFSRDLIKLIESGEFTELSVGEIKPWGSPDNIKQHFIKN